jgi:hypothetical protein
MFHGHASLLLYFYFASAFLASDSMFFVTGNCGILPLDYLFSFPCFHISKNTRIYIVCDNTLYLVTQVFRHLVERVQCRLLFATHYHSLTKEFASHPHVSLQHMACMFRPRSGAHDSNGEKELTFLYRLTSGACPESYGLQVATMAGIPRSIVEKASVAGQAMRSKIAGNFKSSEERAEFSTRHEEWLRTSWTRCTASRRS